MVSSTTRKIISFAISLLVVVISLTGVALGANAPTVGKLSSYTPGFTGSPGKMARDAAGNFYVTDFWGKGIVKLDRQGSKVGFIATLGRPSAVAVLPDNRLVVAMTAPQPYIAFYSQIGSSPNVTGEELSQFTDSAFPALYRPSGIAVDAVGYIYVVDAGDSTTSTTVNVGRVRVYNSAGACVYVFGTRTNPQSTSTLPYYFKQPAGIAYEKESDHIVVVDTLNSRLQFFNNYSGGTTMTHVKSIGSGVGTGSAVVGSAVKFYNAVDVAFEYLGTALHRMYVADRGHNSIAIVNAEAAGTYGFLLGEINATTLAAAPMKFPSAVLFEKTSTGGVLYTNNVATSSPADILSLSIDGGAIPLVGATLSINAIPATSTTSPIAISGSNSGNFAVSCSVNGGAFVSASGTTSWSINNNPNNINLVSGNNNILCKTFDGAVTSFASASTYYSGAPTAGPTVTITSPLTGTYSNNVTQIVSGTTSLANASVKVEGSLGGTCTAISGASNSWSCTMTLPEGINVLTVSAWKAGTAVTTANVTVTVDITPPNMTGTISFLANGSTTTTAVQNIDGIVLDVNLSSVDVNNVAVPAKARVALTGNNTYFSTPVTLVRGLNTVTVKATDLAGNSTTVSRSATLYPEIPGLTVALPADNSYRVAAGVVDASGTVNTIFTSVDACGTSVTPAGGNWSTAAMTVASGFGSCQFTASNGIGSIPVTEKRTINANAAYAQLAIVSPAADLATGNSSVVVSGTVAIESATPKISIDDVTAVDVTSYDSGTGAFSHTVDLFSLGQGLHTVKVIANTATTAVRNIIYDTTLPDITIKSDSKVSPTRISGLIDPSARMSTITASLGTGAQFTIPLSVLTFNPYSQAAGSVVWHANLNGYPYDTITFKTASPAGNEKSLIRTSATSGIPTGDVDEDGVVRLSDALAALRHVAGTESLAGEKKFQADVGALVEGQAGQDGVVDIGDAWLILAKSYGLLSF